MSREPGDTLRGTGPNAGSGVEMAGATHVGKVRSRNEDFLRILPEQGLAILADGMGGHRAGNVASQMAVEIVSDELKRSRDTAGELPSEDDLALALKTANDAIRTVARNDPECFGMGATAVVAAFDGTRYIAAYLGDSRLYRYHNRQLEQLTEDHTLAQQYVREGLMSQREAKVSVGRNMLVKGLGIEKRVAPDIVSGTLAAGEMFLLCTDGLSDVVPEPNILDTLAAAAESPLE
ncbi:MAG: protein phosphatase 2C domain-containing protein, partial [Gammaproteobacteria bacterium]|nr:protein phosphatase 2C domain-containing protein [Gammaproteobacteria bacterium]